VITFLASFVIETAIAWRSKSFAPPNVGAPMHLHHLQEEAITVVAGKLGLSLPVSNRATASRRDDHLEAGCWAPLVNAGTTELRCTGGHTAGTTSSTSSRLLRFDEAEWTKTPGFFDAAFLLTRYRRKYACSTFQRSCKRWCFQFFWPLDTSRKYDNSKTHQNRSWKHKPVLLINACGLTAHAPDGARCGTVARSARDAQPLTRSKTFNETFNDFFNNRAATCV